MGVVTCSTPLAQEAFARAQVLGYGEAPADTGPGQAHNPAVICTTQRLPTPQHTDILHPCTEPCCPILCFTAIALSWLSLSPRRTHRVSGTDDCTEEEVVDEAELHTPASSA